MTTVPEIVVAVLNSLWLAAMIAVLVWLALKLLPRTNAATRHIIWWAALAVILVLPSAPKIKEWLHPQTQAAPATRAKSAAPLSLGAVPLVELPAVVTLQEERSVRWPFWVLALWTAVFVCRFLQITRSYLHLRGVKQRASSGPQALPVSVRSARVLLSREVSSPMAVGFLRPAIILPESLPGELEQPELEHVLLHEAAHIARNDDWSNLAVRLLGAVLALHPVAMWVLRQIEREREMACDDWVVAHTGAPRPYAASLARMFELRWQRRTEPNEALASGIFGRGSLGDRIEVLLQRGRDFSPRASMARVSASAFLLLALMAAGSVAPRWIAFAQQQAKPEFEVASVKPGDPNNRQVSIFMHPGRFTTTNATLKMLIGFAYDVRNHQISGGPNWVDSAKYNIEAKIDSATPIPPGPAGAGQIRQMVQSLLADRFKLAVHRETKEEPVYELTVAKSGSKLKEAASPNGPAVIGATGKGGFQGLRMGRGQLTGTSAPLALLVNTLSQQLGRSVIDKTGLKGNYDFTLQWTPDPAQAAAFGPPGPDAPPPPDPNGPTIFTAVQEQLGLKLESAKGPVDILVIDHAEKPDAN